MESAEQLTIDGRNVMVGTPASNFGDLGLTLVL
jgi:hypothetical protein